jgi:signal transduction histidine kinase
MNSQAQTSSIPENELARQVEQLLRLFEVSESVAAQLDLDPLLQQIVDTATQLLNAEMGTLLVLSEDNERFQAFKVSGWLHEPGGFTSAISIHSLPCRQGVPLRLDDVRNHPQAVGFPCHHPEIGPFLSVPLRRNRRVLGVLCVGNAPGGPTFGPADEELLLAFATQAALAIENARLHAQTEELARLRERQRIAQALHGTLAQMLFTIGLEAKWFLNHLSLDGEPGRRMQTIQRLAGRSSDELRSAIFALRSPYLPGGDGLVDLLQDQVTEFKTQSGLAATLIVSPHFPSLPPLVGEAVYRIVRESLSNVYKHARASAVMVSLHCDDGSVTVTVQDNGVGLAEPLPLEPDDGDLHFGVVTMRQLAAQAQGDLFIGDNDGQGVMVKARFPAPGACTP